MCCWYIWELLCTGSAACVPELHSQPVVSAPSALLIDLRVFSTGIVLNLHSTSRAGLGISKHIGRSLPGSFEIWFGCFPSLQPNDWFPLFCVSHLFFCSGVSPLPLSYFFCSSFAARPPPTPPLLFLGLAGRLGGFLQIGTQMNNASKAWESRELRLGISVCHTFFLYYSHVGTRLLPQSRNDVAVFPYAFRSFD